MWTHTLQILRKKLTWQCNADEMPTAINALGKKQFSSQHSRQSLILIAKKNGTPGNWSTIYIPGNYYSTTTYCCCSNCCGRDNTSSASKRWGRNAFIHRDKCAAVRYVHACRRVLFCVCIVNSIVICNTPSALLLFLLCGLWIAA